MKIVKALLILGVAISLSGCTESSMKQVLEEKTIYCTVDSIDADSRDYNGNKCYENFRVTITDNDLNTQATFDISDEVFYRIGIGYTVLWNRVKYLKPNTGETGYMYQLVANDTAELKEGSYQILDTENIGVKVISAITIIKHVSTGKSHSNAYYNYVKYIDEETGEIRTEEVSDKAFETAKQGVGTQKFEAVRQTLVVSGGNLAYRYQLKQK